MVNDKRRISRRRRLAYGRDVVTQTNDGVLGFFFVYSPFALLPLVNICYGF